MAEIDIDAVYSHFVADACHALLPSGAAAPAVRQRSGRERITSRYTRARPC